jgi:poly(3-hydroxybutyrate) depolymerase
MDRHVNAHRELYMNLVQGDGDSAAKHREFYDEYLAVMDLSAEYYLQTVETIFMRHALPKGEMLYRDHLIDPGAIRRVALMTVEGEKDDITGIGQCKAAHGLCRNLSAGMKKHHLQPKAGHYGIFNGSRFKTDIVPEIVAFTRLHDPRRAGALRRWLRAIRGAHRIETPPPPLTEEEGAVVAIPVATAVRRPQAHSKRVSGKNITVLQMAAATKMELGRGLGSTY